MTECIQETFGFTDHFSRRVEASFSAGHVSSDGGALLLREVDRKLDLLGRAAACFRDGRSPMQVKHPVAQLLARCEFWRQPTGAITAPRSRRSLLCWKTTRPL